MKQILLLDEPFKNLDETSQAVMVEQLNKLKEKRTIILIAEQMPANLLADQIISADLQEQAETPPKKVVWNKIPNHEK